MMGVMAAQRARFGVIRLVEACARLLGVILALAVALAAHGQGLAAGRWTSATLSSTTQSPAVAVVGSKILLAGGYLFPSSAGYATDAVDILDTATGRWSSARLSTPRAELKTATVGSKAFFFGGVGGRGGHYEPAKGAVDVYDDATGAWMALKLPSVGDEDWVAISGGAVVGTKLIVAGRLFAAAYDDATGQWSTAPIAERMYGAVVVAAGTKALIVGGRTLAGPSAAVDIYDDTTGHWSTTRLSKPRETPVAAVVADTLVIAGGPTDAPGDAATIDLYHAATGQWSSAAVPGRLSSPAIAAVGETVLLASGSFASPEQADGRIYAYDVRAGRWKTLALPVARTTTRLATIENRILVFGVRAAQGGQRPPFQDADRVDVYDLDTDTWTVAQLSAARIGIAVARTGRTLLLAGGYGVDAPGDSDAVDVYDAAIDRWSTARLAYPRGDIVGAAVGSTVVVAAGRPLGAALGPGGSRTSGSDVYEEIAE